MKKLFFVAITAGILFFGLFEEPNAIYAQDDFDKETCEMNCGWRFGSADFGTVGFRVYESCIRQCNDRYWKAFDKRIKDLEKSSK